MVSAGGGSSSLPRGVAARPGLAGRLFLALCPSPPGPLTLRSLVNLVVAALTTAATATVSPSTAPGPAPGAQDQRLRFQQCQDQQQQGR
jgi:hypothetical protein